MRTITALTLAGVLALGACSATGAASPVTSATQSASATASAEPASPTAEPASPSAEPASPSAEPEVTEGPTQVVPPNSLDARSAEADLLKRVRLDLQNLCEPLRAGLPDRAIAGIECAPSSKIVGRVTVYMFDTQKDLLAAYEARMAAHDVPMRTNGGLCLPDIRSEGGYVPGDGHEGIVVVERGGCYPDAHGKAHYVATVPPYVLFEVVGKTGNLEAVDRWAFRGNKDQPGGPTIWRDNGPASPEK